MTDTISSLFSVAGKVALVTGGSDGIGRMIAGMLVKAGVHVWIIGRKPVPLARAAAELSAEGGAVDTIAADLSQQDEIARVARELTERAPKLHMLVNNAGTTWGASFAEFPLSGFDKVMSLNVRTPFLLTQALLPLLSGTATDDDYSRVINISSVGARSAGKESSVAYSPSKAAIEQMTRVMASHLGEHRVSVNCISPGWFPTRMNAPLGEQAAAHWVAENPLRRLGDATDIGAMVIFLCSRGGAYVNGQVIDLDGGRTL